MKKTVAQIIAEDEDLTKLLREVFMWVGRPFCVARAVIKLRAKLRDEHRVEFEVYT